MKTILITGATAGIGKATADIFAKNGFNVIVTGRRKDRLDKLAKELAKKYEVQSLPLCFDVQKRTEVEKAVNALGKEWKKIDVLVNNAGLALGLSTIQEGNIDDWETMIDTNVKGLLYMTRMVAPIMIENGSGHIINIGSVAGKETYPNGNVYCATKHAVDTLSKAMRIDMLPHGIKVTAIHPGMAETEFSLVRYKGDTEKAKKVYAGLKALTAEDIAETIYWTASRPEHVNISDLVITPKAQANATTVKR